MSMDVQKICDSSELRLQPELTPEIPPNCSLAILTSEKPLTQSLTKVDVSLSKNRSSRAAGQLYQWSISTLTNSN